MSDQISYTFGAKIPGPLEYGNLHFSVTFSSDVKAGESPDAAFSRVKKFVDDKCEKEFEAIEAINVKDSGETVI